MEKCNNSDYIPVTTVKFGDGKECCWSVGQIKSGQITLGQKFFSEATQIGAVSDRSLKLIKFDSHLLKKHSERNTKIFEPAPPTL